VEISIAQPKMIPGGRCDKIKWKNKLCKVTR
jgi:hypothetical protein